MRLLPARRSAVPLLALLLAVGGASSGVAGGAPAAAAVGATRLALAPLNLALGHAPELVEAERIVEAELLRYLGERGVRVGVVQVHDAEQAWLGALREIEDGGDPGERLDRAAGAFARRLREDGDFPFDCLVLPSLAYRPARVHGRIASWDGVRRRVHSRRARGASQAHYFREWEGRISGLSLQVRVYGSDGRRVYAGWGGLDLTHDPVVVGSTMAPQPIPQAHILGEPAHVREGIALAFGDSLDASRR